MSSPGPLRLEQIHHLGMVVADLEEACRPYLEGLGFSRGEPELLEEVEALFVSGPGVRIELMRPLTPDSSVGRFLERRGQGFHHVAYRVEDLRLALEQARRAGLELVDQQPRPGALGTQVAFLHPRSLGGVLTELVEDP